MILRARVVGFICIAVFVGMAGDAKYIGAAKCAKMCHKAKSKGNQYGAWQEAAHSKAYQTLASEKSQAIAKEKGIADAQNASECLKCHVTAYTEPDEAKAATYKIEDGVNCESCHGAGSNYAKLSIMKDHEKSLANGMVDPDKDICIKCHNEESPTYKEFNYEEAIKKIAHPNPKKSE